MESVKVTSEDTALRAVWGRPSTKTGNFVDGKRNNKLPSTIRQYIVDGSGLVVIRLDEGRRLRVKCAPFMDGSGLDEKQGIVIAQPDAQQDDNDSGD